MTYPEHPYGNPQAPFYPPTPQPVESIQHGNGLGLTGFILGLVGLCFSPIPLIGVVAWPLVIIGLIFSIIGIRVAKKHNAKHRGKSIAGLVCSIVGLAVCIIWVAATSAAVHDTNQYQSCINNAQTESQLEGCHL